VTGFGFTFTSGLEKTDFLNKKMRFFLFKSDFLIFCLWFPEMCNWFLLCKLIRTWHVELKCKNVSVANLLHTYYWHRLTKAENRRKIKKMRFFLFKSDFLIFCLWFPEMCNWFLLCKLIRTWHVELKCKNVSVSNLLHTYYWHRLTKAENRRKIPYGRC